MKNYQQKLLRALMKFYFIRVFFITVYNLVVKNPVQKRENDLALGLDPNKITSEVREKGFSSVFHLNPQLVNALVADCQKMECVAEEDDTLRFRIDVTSPVNPNEKYIKYMYKNALGWQSVKDIIHNASVLKISKDYLGNEPVIQSVAIWWSFPKPESMRSNIYNFHYDIDNLKFIKLFTYLTNVDEHSGPHIIYPSTHKHKTILQKKYRSVPDQKVSEVLGSQKPVVMVGAKGTSFFEDTFSYHKGLNPEKPRLIFQIEYSLTHNKLG